MYNREGNNFQGTLNKLTCHEKSGVFFALVSLLDSILKDQLLIPLTALLFLSDSMCQKIKRKHSKNMKRLKAIETTLLLPWYRSASSKASRAAARTASVQAVSLSQIIPIKCLERGRDHPAEL